MDWLEISVIVAAVDEETVADVLRARTGSGVAIEEGRDGLASLRAYLPRDQRLLARRRTLQRALSRLDLSRPLQRPRSRTVREEDWANAWKKHFRLQRVGPFVICPCWRRYRPRPGELVIRLDPGMAFGTGQHPTTRMCLLALAERVAEGDRVLDLGTGSGILAIAAALLGAREVIALDTDPLAVQIAKENVATNGVAARVDVREGSLGSSRPAVDGLSWRFDCVVANISSAAIIDLAPDLVRALRPGGVGIAGGIGSERVDGCRRSLEQAGARVIDMAVEGEWRTVLFEGSSNTI